MIYFLLLFILSCGVKDLATENINKNNNIEDIKSNHWANKKSWGTAKTNIDFSGKINFFDDNRIHNLHKESHIYLKDYVLWRGRHDGSCWISSNLALLLYSMVEGGAQHFQKTLDKLKEISDNYSVKDPLYKENNNTKEFFDVFIHIKANLTHRFWLDFINNENVYQSLNLGLRKLLAVKLRANNEIQEAQNAEGSLTSWGYANDFSFLFKELNLSYPVIQTNVSGHNVVSSSKIGVSKINPQTMIILQSTPDYIDILVKKEFSDKINKSK